MSAVSSAGGGWTPFALGASLLAWWAADRTDLITMDGSNRVSSWVDAVGGYTATQATQAAQPIWSATGFNTRPAITGDGVDDFMVLAVPAAMPIGATPFEEWWAVDQKTDASITTSTTIGSYGGSSVNNCRLTNRAVVSAVNRVRVSDTSGGTGNTITEGTVDFTGRSVLRSYTTGTQIGLEINGVAATPLSAVAALTNTRIRFFGNQSNTAPTVFGNVAIADRVFTTILSAGDATRLRAYLMQGL